MSLAPPHLELRTSVIPGAGKGLFTTADIAKGTRLGEYAGRHFRKDKILSGHREGYSYSTSNGVIVSPADDCLFRYANDNVDLEQSLLHKEVIRYPNMPCNIDWFTPKEEAKAARELGETLGHKRWMSKEFLETERVWIVALSDIKAGSELLIHYGDMPDRPGSAADGYWTCRITSRKHRLELPPVSGEALAKFLDERVSRHWARQVCQKIQEELPPEPIDYLSED